MFHFFINQTSLVNIYVENAASLQRGLGEIFLVQAVEKKNSNLVFLHFGHFIHKI